MGPLIISTSYLMTKAFGLMIMIYHEYIFCLFKAVAVHCNSCHIDSSTVNINCIQSLKMSFLNFIYINSLLAWDLNADAAHVPVL